MSFRDVPGQESVVEFFRRAVKSERLAHAYILVGPEGVGKRALARSIAQYLFCGARKDDACGACRACRLIAADQFADLHWYSREEGRAQLRVEIIEEFQRAVNFKPVESDRKVFVLEDADKLNPAGANKLLKVLEEPPPRSLIILLALDVRDFLPTILSRCHVIRMKPLAADALVADLTRDGRCTAEQARYLAAFTMGTPGLARELATPEFFAERDALVAAAANLRDGGQFAFAENLYKRSGEKDESSALTGRREALLRVFDVLALFYRDALAAAHGTAPEALVSSAHAHAAQALGTRIGPDRLAGILDTITRARDAVAFNANQKLLLENLTFDIAKLQSP